MLIIITIIICLCWWFFWEKLAPLIRVHIKIAHPLEETGGGATAPSAVSINSCQRKCAVVFILSAVNVKIQQVVTVFTWLAGKWGYGQSRGGIAGGWLVFELQVCSGTVRLSTHLNCHGAGTGKACWLERWTCDRKIASSNSGRSGGRIFFFRANLACWLLFVVRSTPVLPQWQVKDPGHSAKSADGRLHLNMHTPLTQRG